MAAQRPSCNDEPVLIHVHTAKCTKCDRYNKDVLRKCPACSYSLCAPCFAAKARDFKHRKPGGLFSSLNDEINAVLGGQAGISARVPPVTTPALPAGELPRTPEKSTKPFPKKPLSKRLESPHPPRSALNRPSKRRLEPDLQEFPDTSGSTQPQSPPVPQIRIERKMRSANGPPTLKRIARSHAPRKEAGSSHDESSGESDTVGNSPLQQTTRSGRVSKQPERLTPMIPTAGPSKPGKATGKLPAKRTPPKTRTASKATESAPGLSGADPWKNLSIKEVMSKYEVPLLQPADYMTPGEWHSLDLSKRPPGNYEWSIYKDQRTLLQPTVPRPKPDPIERDLARTRRLKQLLFGREGLPQIASSLPHGAGQEEAGRSRPSQSLDTDPPWSSNLKLPPISTFSAIPEKGIASSIGKRALSHCIEAGQDASGALRLPRLCLPPISTFQASFPTLPDQFTGPLAAHRILGSSGECLSTASTPNMQAFLEDDGGETEDELYRAPTPLARSKCAHLTTTISEESDEAEKGHLWAPSRFPRPYRAQRHLPVLGGEGEDVEMDDAHQSAQPARRSDLARSNMRPGVCLGDIQQQTQSPHRIDSVLPSTDPVGADAGDAQEQARPTHRGNPAKQGVHPAVLGRRTY